MLHYQLFHQYHWLLLQLASHLHMPPEYKGNKMRHLCSFHHNKHVPSRAEKTMENLYSIGSRKSKIILAVCRNNNIFNSRGIGFYVSNQLSKFCRCSVTHSIRYVKSCCSSLYNFTQNLIQEFPIRPGMRWNKKIPLVFTFLPSRLGYISILLLRELMTYQTTQTSYHPYLLFSKSIISCVLKYVQLVTLLFLYFFFFHVDS